MNSIQFINESNKENLNKPANSDHIYYSELNEWYTANALRSFSIKCVLEGSIYYKLENREYKVTKDHFFLATKQPHVNARFNSREKVKSVCIDICEDSVLDALTVLANEQKNEITEFNSGYLQQPHFFEHIYAVDENELGKKLKRLFARFREKPFTAGEICVNRESFLELVELVILTEHGNQQSLKRLSAIRANTKKEILKRTMSGREFIDSCYLQNPHINAVARESNMSEFHFYRSFKQVYGITPYQYILEKRLMHANRLMKKESFLISEIATECGFPDAFTFSKAYKRKYGYSPSKLFQQHDVKDPLMA